MLSDLQSIVDDESAKYIILEAPAGFGKSAVAVSIAKYLGSSYICTGTKELQEQYCKDFHFPKVLGSSNFECLENKQVDCSKGPCRMPESRELGSDQSNALLETDYKCSYKPMVEQYRLSDAGVLEYESCKLCGLGVNNHSHVDIDHPCLYYDQKYKGLVASHTVLNYSYMLALALHTDEIPQRKLLILDEAHTIEEKMVEHSQVIFTRKGLERIMPRFQFPTITKQNEFEIITWLRVLEAIASDVSIMLEINAHIRDLKKNRFMLSASDVDFTFGDMINRLKFATKETKSEYKQGIYDFVRSPRMTDSSSRFHDTAYEAALNLIAKLKAITEQLRKAPDQWIIRSVIRDRVAEQVVKVEITPLDISEKLAVLFGKGERVLLMSATILSKENFCKTLGLKENEVTFIQVSDSDFPIANRPIYTLDVASLNYNTMSGELPNIARAVDQLMSLHPDEKGIIHVTRYDHLQYIRDNISSNNRRRLLATTKAGYDADPTTEALSREELMRKHETSSTPTVIISPSMHLGIDLKDDLSRFQIIVKVPYMDMNDRWIAKKMKASPSWYGWQAVLRISQMYGRSIRSREDYAKTYILDRGFQRLYGKESDLFPKWFKEALSSRAEFEAQLT